MAAPRQIKGILKNKNTGSSTSSLSGDPPAETTEPDPGLSDEDHQKKSQKWDEMNILATYHPPDKDYGMMKIDEPSTPYNRMVGEDDETALSDSEGQSGLAADDLASKLAAADDSEPRFMTAERNDEDSEEEEEHELTEEEQARKTHFKMMRKIHYNEAMNIKLARQLIARELEDDHDDEEMTDESEVAENINVDPPPGVSSFDS